MSRYFAVATLIMACSIHAQDTSAISPTPILVDASADRHPISPYIYGVNFGTTKVLADLGATVNRSGGDSASVYNWKLNARNAGRDWFFESLPCSSDYREQFGDNFVAMTSAGGAQTMLTIPTIGWVAKLGPNRSSLASFSLARYGLQHATDIHGMAEAGDGLRPDGSPISNDPNDAQQFDPPENEVERVRHTIARWKPASSGGVLFYILDNEPERWHDIHRDVHPTGQHASELATSTLTFSRKIKSLDPSAKVVAPEISIPTGYLHSGFDLQRAELNDQQTPRDRKRETGGMDLLPWLLMQWKSAGHPIDVVSVHIYPQSGEYAQSNDVSERMQLIRNRSTRMLWDKAYLDPTWINDRVALIPRLRQWVDQYYVPGTPLAITEYNWGAEASMNGATTQADILGIFGRENLYLATRWIAPAVGTPTYLSMKLYRNYDNHGGQFGETSIRAIAPDVDTVSAFAALRQQDHALTIVVINKKLKQNAPVRISFREFANEGSYETYLLSKGVLAPLPARNFLNRTLESNLPPQSVALYILHPNAH